jgi:hypothetical protein
MEFSLGIDIKNSCIHIDNNNLVSNTCIVSNINSNCNMENDKWSQEDETDDTKILDNFI